MREELDIFRALADPTRLRIMALLRAMELSVGELAQVLGQSQPRVSRHVKILVDAALAERRKEGSWVFLGPGARERVDPLFHAIDCWGDAGESHWTQADLARLVAVRADRQAAAERYFADHAEEWDAIRSLHVAETEVEAAMARVLGEGGLGRLVDIGTGTGRMLELFAARADSAVGIDRSPEMLRLARAKLSESKDRQAELRQGDMYAIDLPDASADTIILHQVLHFAQQPGAAIAEAARLLDGGGRLLIVDFAPHEREELRASDAHARLGFSDEQIEQWFDRAKLEGGRADALAGGELSVNLWLATRPEETRLKVVAA